MDAPMRSRRATAVLGMVAVAIGGLALSLAAAFLAPSPDVAGAFTLQRTCTSSVSPLACNVPNPNVYHSWIEVAGSDLGTNRLQICAYAITEAGNQRSYKAGFGMCSGTGASVFTTCLSASTPLSEAWDKVYKTFIVSVNTTVKGFTPSDAGAMCL